MNPIAIFRHIEIEGPGYLAEFLDAHRLPWQMIAIDKGDTVPQSVDAYSGLVFMGGSMSVNDDLAWIADELALIRAAIARDIPVLGHCLGGQLISRALGAEVSRNPCKEIGWGEVTVADNDSARCWFGANSSFDAFHWHGETFSLPHGATHLLSSAYCTNQAYAIGKHLALQCHVEMNASLITSWCKAGADEINTAGPAVQSAADMQRQMPDKLPDLQRVAAHLYTRWVAGLR